jgi:hypothetical protein
MTPDIIAPPGLVGNRFCKEVRRAMSSRTTP